jgi:hypothetical protein
MMAQSSGSSRSWHRPQAKHPNRFQLPAAWVAASTRVISPIAVMSASVVMGMVVTPPPAVSVGDARPAALRVGHPASTASDSISSATWDLL